MRWPIKSSRLVSKCLLCSLFQKLDKFESTWKAPSNCYQKCKYFSNFNVVLKAFFQNVLSRKFQVDKGFQMKLSVKLQKVYTLLVSVATVSCLPLSFSKDTNFSKKALKPKEILKYVFKPFFGFSCRNGYRAFQWPCS